MRKVVTVKFVIQADNEGALPDMGQFQDDVGSVLNIPQDSDSAMGGEEPGQRYFISRIEVMDMTPAVV